MRIPICLRGERAASMHFVKVRGARDSPKVGPCTGKPLPRRRISRIVCDGGLSGCESMRLSGPVPCANLREDLLQRDHPERPSHEGVIQASEIEDGPEAAILFGDEEVMAVKA